ncbi:ComF family protein [Bdellovibrio sp. HCB-162]|uniref:ComF family protein n=1 Tax=Bdellovibrio sp. HCB-162 TaxID=3394234 RepID=UPI0039BCC396
MKSLLRLMQNHCSCCLNCGSFMISESLLCKPCEERLKFLEQQEPRQAPPFTVRSHYYWYPGQSDLLSELVLALKGSGHQRAWEHYAQKFTKKLSSSLHHRRICVIPAPAKKINQVDHAYLWGKALADSLGAGFLPCLEKVSSGSQRGAGRGERALVEMEAHVKTSSGVDFSTETLWIFADDVLTTGATARAAHLALGSPAHFEVWVLAQRGLSCGASKDLL